MKYLPIVESLIEKDKKFINLPNDNGDYPLFLAINLNNVEIIQKFVTNGVNMNIKDQWGRKPVEVAKAAQQHIKTPDEADKMSKIIDILSTEERKERLFNKLFQHAIYGVNTCVNFIIYVLLIVPNFCINVHSTITMIF
jgi:ankyrin repeat protein